jgi:hypothetical protein
VATVVWPAAIVRRTGGSDPARLEPFKTVELAVGQWWLEAR